MSKENRNFSDFKNQSKEKKFDAIKFKRQLQDNVLKRYNPKNSYELMECINKNALKSSLYEKYLKNSQNKKTLEKFL
jgi:hypothetical protein